MKCQAELNFIRQALIDYSRTLAPSAAGAFAEIAQRSFDAVVADLTQATTPAGTSVPPSEAPAES
jgi:hypothetical protein